MTLLDDFLAVGPTSQGNVVKRVQRALARSGEYDGEIDGLPGWMTSHSYSEAAYMWATRNGEGVEPEVVADDEQVTSDGMTPLYPAGTPKCYALYGDDGRGLNATFSKAQFNKWNDACKEQAEQDIGPHWGQFEILVGTDDDIHDDGPAAHRWRDDSTIGDFASGHHSERGNPSTTSYMETAVMNSANPPVTGSHEYVEWFVNMIIKSWHTLGFVRTPDQAAWALRFLAAELADPVSRNTYPKSNGELVSDFVLRRYFGDKKQPSEDYHFAASIPGWTGPRLPREFSHAPGGFWLVMDVDTRQAQPISYSYITGDGTTQAASRAFSVETNEHGTGLCFPDEYETVIPLHVINRIDRLGIPGMVQDIVCAAA